MEIKNETIIKILNENIAEILKDVMTGYRSPVKALFEDTEGEIYKTLKETAEKTFKEVISSDSFQEELKNKLLQTAVEGMMRR
jgi:uncharacterized membrane-anchored protein YjiN (DUF445 family)